MDSPLTGHPGALLQDRIVLVTGAGQGLGRSLAAGLAAHGATVVAADIQREAVQQTADAIRERGGQALAFGFDQSRERDVDGLFDQVVQAVGQIDVLVNNASIFAALRRGPAADISAAEFRAVVDVNLTGVFLCCRAALRSMVQNGSGSIVNIASSSIFTAGNRVAHYVAAKAGVVGLTRALAREYGTAGVRVNAISPGSTDTGARSVTPELLARTTALRSIPRVQVPEDLVGAVAFLSSEMSAFITGQNLVVDGGATFR